jgi:hypothetical protein
MVHEPLFLQQDADRHLKRYRRHDDKKAIRICADILPHLRMLAQ